VQLTPNINDFGRNAARDFASGANQDFFSCQVALNDAIDHGFGGYKKHPLDGNAIADNDAFKWVFFIPSKAVVNGIIEGDLTAEEVLIGPTGKITGRISAKVIDVRGQLHNTVVSEKSLIIRSTGKITGKIHYVEIEIEKGGEIEGTLTQATEGTLNAASILNNGPAPV